WVLDGQRLLSGRTNAAALGEAAVADIDRTLAPAQVAQDVWTGLTFEEVAKVFEDCLQLDFIGRIDRGELSTRPAVGVLGVAEQDELQAADELERDTAGYAVLQNRGGNRFGVVDARRRVDLPSLRRDT